MISIRVYTQLLKKVCSGPLHEVEYLDLSNEELGMVPQFCEQSVCILLPSAYTVSDLSCLST